MPKDKDKDNGNGNGKDSGDDAKVIAQMAATLFASEQRTGSMDNAVLLASQIMKKAKAQQEKQEKEEKEEEDDDKDKDGDKEGKEKD